MQELITVLFLLVMIYLYERKLDKKYEEIRKELKKPSAKEELPDL